MKTASVSSARTHLSEYIKEVNTDHNEIILTNNGKDTAVLMSFEDYTAWQETRYLLASPKNAKRLLKSRKNADKGNLIEVVLESA